jgi:formylglycine-generating enzyme required for sulfatase activity
MHGNVWEWCEDDWHSNYNGAPSDGSAWMMIMIIVLNRLKLLRGGSWFFDLLNSAVPRVATAQSRLP